MKTFGSIPPKNYTIEKFYANSPFRWTLISSSMGTTVVDPPELDTAVTIVRGNGDRNKFINDNRRTGIQPDSNENGVPEHVIYSSIKHLFYDNGVFISGSSTVTSSLAGLPDDIFIMSVGQDFYGEQIKPGSFELGTELLANKIQDDFHGNLYVSESGIGYYVGNIFYEDGIAVIKHDITRNQDSITSDGLKFISGSTLDFRYQSQVKNIRHEIVVKLKPNDFNFSWLNPSVRKSIVINGEFSEEIKELNIPELDENEWTIQSLMQSGVIKPYVTTIGLYTDKFELVAVAKLSTPVQRTFDSDQIFIVRFDV
jgi:hypothetical protein